jgi:hypothetical protein
MVYVCVWWFMYDGYVCMMICNTTNYNLYLDNVVLQISIEVVFLL